ncbi:Cytochrome oxidase biogenesis protein Surf1, facilitates heme A insertion [Myxococcus hansupus]|uniref:Cytochrome oxidase biogenesis protein Surf1, facilitates heme A insertion n=1 Tax=Pseudomyxococcus hansupus TaxID=1297742 RepID=A0A0H4WRD3_9BACT|nr:lamin tail domain-containing protein [Myxococcus hansupus]AKQ66041.1 Cytochrome oxidase biogenesis protein Surf1, facilitates heme A insertion [Myxococcus hansupus]
MPWSFRQLLAPLSALLLFMSACGDDPVEVRPVCGNGIVEAGETCDDGNRINGDGCENTCRPTPDAGTGEPDSGTPDDDAGTGEDDAGTIEDDAGTGEDDAGTIEDDAGTGEPDSGTGEPDSGTGEPDSGTGEPDSGTGEPDSGTGEPDSGTGEPDSGTGEPDSGTGEPDSGTGEPDSGTGEPDSGTGEPDSGTGEPDSGTGEPDSGTGEPDSGTGEPDSGTGEPDSGTDAGTVQVSLESFGPTGVFARTGTTAPTFPEALTIRLREDAPAEVWVEVASSSPAVTVQGGMVRFAAGERTATVQVTANIDADPETDKATLTATLGNDSREATVRVLAVNQVAELSTLSPEAISVAAGEVRGFTVELDVPPAQDTVIQLALEPANLGTVPATVTVAANTLSAKFDFTAGGTGAEGSLVATVGGASISAAIEVTVASTNHIVISEIAPAGPGGANDEFVELYNPTSSPVDISGYRIQYKSATGANYTGNYALPSGSIIAPRSYFLVGSGSYAGTPARDASWGTVFAMAAGSGHVRLGYPELAQNDPLGHPLVIDTVGYGSTANAPEGNRIPASAPAAGSYERKASATSTVESMTAGGADELRGNGYDSDDNAADFIVRPTRQPQNTASPAEQ